MNEMPFTGERLVTGLTNHYGVIEHLHRYAVALEFCKDKIVLDIACGEGYGSNLISKIANKVIGVDISDEAINHAKLKYINENLEFNVGSADNIPLLNNSVDVVVSFETIEHHDKHLEMFKEIKRVLKSDGLMIMSSPEKSIYYERDPNNPYHIKELTSEEFLTLTQSFFKITKHFKQRFVHASLLSPNIKDEIGEFKVYGGNYNNIEKALNEVSYFYNKPYFNLIIASDHRIDFNQTSIFDGSDVIDKDKEYLKYKVNMLENSTSFKIGSKIVKILSLIPFLKR